ncbi:MAG: hypothetical protein AAFY56_14065 [Pseudomonadota bacterium]
MPTPKLQPGHAQWPVVEAIAEAYREGGGDGVHGLRQDIAKRFDLPWTRVDDYLRRYQEAQDSDLIFKQGYDLNLSEKTPEEAWNEHDKAFERTVSGILQKRWRTIKRPKGPFVIFHATDEHLDDDATPLRLVKADIDAAHGMGAIMCHGGDALNNWPLAGKLAKKWADQQCTLPDALLRLQFFIEAFKPDVWTDGNHEEMNPYLDQLISGWLPEKVIRDYWSVNFRVETGGRPIRVIMSHKFQKGSSWFHKAHGHIREMLEGEEADILMDGHLHSDGVLDHTLPERGHSALCVASAGYKIVDQYAARISRGGKIPKLRGRAHWIVCDPFCEPDENLAVAYKSPRQAEAYLNSLQNLKAA